MAPRTPFEDDSSSSVALSWWAWVRCSLAAWAAWQAFGARPAWRMGGAHELLAAQCAACTPCCPCLEFLFCQEDSCRELPWILVEFPAGVASLQPWAPFWLSPPRGWHTLQRLWVLGWGGLWWVCAGQLFQRARGRERLLGVRVDRTSPMMAQICHPQRYLFSQGVCWGVCLVQCVLLGAGRLVAPPPCPGLLYFWSKVELRTLTLLAACGMHACSPAPLSCSCCALAACEVMFWVFLLSASQDVRPARNFQFVAVLGVGSFQVSRVLRPA